MRSRPSTAGLSLIEVMMVLFIVALLSGVVLLSRPQGPDPIDLELEKLSQTATALSDRAILTGIPHALEVRDDRYQGLRRRDGDWVPVRGQTRVLQRRFRLQMCLETEQPRGARDEVALVQQVVFDPTGIPPEGRLEIRDGTDHRVLDVGRLGALVEDTPNT